MLEIETNHNIYILGAGYSVQAGYPVLNNFMATMREAAEWLESEKRMYEFESIRKVLQFRKEASSAAYRIKLNIDNIEQLFSLATASDQNSLSNSIVDAISATLSFCEQFSPPNYYIVNLAEKIGEELNLEPLIEGFNKYTLKLNGEEKDFRHYNLRIFDTMALALNGSFSESKQKNTIITFNYDLEIERSFYNLKIPFSYQLEDVLYDNKEIDYNFQQAIPIYKLHGSTNWAFPKNKDEKLTIYKNYNDAFEKAKYRLLLPPTWQKIFTGPLESVWKNSISAISTATRIIIAGFSIPETDIHFKYLLAAGLQNNISLQEIIIINPESKEKINNKLANIFQEEFLKNIKIVHYKQDVSDFFLSSENLNRINRNSDNFSGK